MSDENPKRAPYRYRRYGRADDAKRYDPKRGKREMEVYRDLVADDDDENKDNDKGD